MSYNINPMITIVSGAIALAVLVWVVIKNRGIASHLLYLEKSVRCVYQDLLADIINALRMRPIKSREDRKSLEDRNSFRQYIESFIKYLEPLEEPIILPSGQYRFISSKKIDAINKMGPKTFYYLDNGQVRDLYCQVFQELQPKQIETHEKERSQKSIGADFKLVAKYGTRQETETKTTYEPELTSPVMYNQVQDYLVKNNNVIFGLEDFDYDKSSIDEFKSMCAAMEKKFSFSVPEELQEKFISDKLHEFALNHSKEIAQSSGFVSLQGEFLVAKVDHDCRSLSYSHPLNQYLAQGDTSISIEILCHSPNLSSSGSTTFTPDSSVKITCVGKVVRWNSKEGLLTINPIAIF